MQAGNGNQYHCPEISHQTVGKRKESAPKAMPKQMSVEIADPKAEHTSYDIRSSSLTHAIIEATDTTIKNIESSKNPHPKQLSAPTFHKPKMSNH